MSFEDVDPRLQKIHDLSDHHRESILSSNECGCFSCLRRFEPQKIKEWIRSEGTAMCPYCGIDAVLGDKDVEITDALLKEMWEAWFNTFTTITVDPLTIRHGDKCPPDCEGCTCPTGSNDPGDVCLHCFNTPDVRCEDDEDDEEMDFESDEERDTFFSNVLEAMKRIVPVEEDPNLVDPEPLI